MTYIRLDDGFSEHAKVLSLSDCAYRVYVNGLCYCSRRLTDGCIPVTALHLLHPRAGKRHAEELIAAGLWEPCDGGWNVHDYLNHQRSRAVVVAQKSAAQERVQRWRNGRRNVDETHANGNVTALHARPETETETETENYVLSAAAARARARFAEATGQAAPRSGTLAEQLENLGLAHPAECIDWAFDKATGKDEPWRYARTILSACTLEGHGPRTRKEVRRGNEPW